MAHDETQWSLYIFAESVNQLVTPTSQLAKVVIYAWGMGDGSIITVPLKTEVFGTDFTIYLERDYLLRFIACQEISGTCIYVK